MKKKQYTRSQVFEVVNAILVAESDKAGGRQLPLLVVERGESPLLREAIHVHEHVFTGDCDSQWAQPVQDRSVLHLRLNFRRPIVTEIFLEFKLGRFALVVDHMIRSQCVYLLEGGESDTYFSTLDRPRIRVDLPSTGFEPRWSKLLLKTIEDKYRQEGSKRKVARKLAKEHIDRSRTLANYEL